MPEATDPPAPGEGPTYCTYTTYESGEGSEEYPATGAGAEGLAADVWSALYGVEDPEMPVSVVDLGLVYGVEIHESGAAAGEAEPSEARDALPVDGAHVRVDLTLTYTGCPAREMLTDDVEAAVEAVEGVAECEVRLVWSPEWSLEMVTDTGRDDLREFGLSVD